MEYDFIKTVCEVGNDVETEFAAYDHATGNPPTPPDTSKLAKRVLTFFANFQV